MRVVPVNPMQPRRDRLEIAVDVLRRGGLVALPTETFYGIAADSHDSRALERVNRLKGKAADAPVLLLAADADQARAAAAVLPPEFDALAGRFWPGPLTIVVTAAPNLPAQVGGGRGTVALRVPGLELPRLLAEALSRPISGVSANPHGMRPCREAAQVVDLFGSGLDVILDGGRTSGGAPSTIVDLTVDPPRLLREGLLPSVSLEPFLPGLQRPTARRTL